MKKLIALRILMQSTLYFELPLRHRLDCLNLLVKLMNETVGRIERNELFAK